MQDALFPDDEAVLAEPAPPALPAARPRGAGVQARPVDEEERALAAALPRGLHLGGSSWTYPGWAGLVWDKRYSEQQLSKSGLAAYARLPLLRAVSIDRGFYQPLTASQYERYAVQVPEDFRFTVKAPSLVCDALLREDGRGLRANSGFLDPALALQEFVEPALEGLGGKIGALVFQLSPLSAPLREDMAGVLRRLEQMLQALPSLKAVAPDGVVAVEVRDPEFLTPEFAAILRAAGATYCLGLHPKLPPLAQQLPILRALWPGPLVCRWNLHRLHGPYGYEEALKRYGEFDRIVDADPDTHAGLAKVIRGTTAAGHKAYVTVSNQAEGCAPLSLQTLARAVLDQG
ncbi:DUF72 domain-containing protein [Roseateles violae]|uniref:DUF72 domain-containing protein n=1 Tax=Roseateles violae TaxID=3058042 RepID=A0ABT8DY30_9BURK|nr:DUF72 domain-containing protein [Pelomonas sp. PFR6]MDN3922067.1 DUF72 domain-containing protein [Pelomonas sp. PFR6]